MEATVGVRRRYGKIDVDERGMGVTTKGFATAGAPAADTLDVAPAMDMSCQRLRRGETPMPRTVVEVSAAGVANADLAATADYEFSGGTVSTYLGALWHNGLIEQRGDVLVATDVLRGSA